MLPWVFRYREPWTRATRSIATVFHRSTTSAALKFATPIGPARAGKPWSTEEDERLLQMRREGFKMLEIAAALDRSMPSVCTRCYTVLRPEARVRKSNRNPLTPQDIKTILRLREKGWTWNQIQIKYPDRSPASICYATIYACRALNGSKAQLNHGVFAPWEDAKIRQLREQDRLPWSDVASALNRSANLVAQRYLRITNPTDRVKIPRRYVRLPPLTTHDMPEIIRLRDDGLSWRDIENALDGRGSYSKIFRMYNDHMDGATMGSGSPSSGRCYTAIEDAQIQKLRAEGKTPRQIASNMSERSHLSVTRRLGYMASTQRPGEISPKDEDKGEGDGSRR